MQGRLFVVGDIHGCFSLLECELEKVNFDESTDKLISVGDLVDRGPESDRAMEFLKKPWFTAIMGNHEAMCHPEHAGSYWHCMNGGSWYNDLLEQFAHDRQALEDFVKPLWNLPVYHEETFNGRKYGFLHASLCGLRDWNDVPAFAIKYDRLQEHPMLWDRSEVMGAKTANFSGLYADEFWVDNIDHVYFGHTPLKEPITVGNCTWLDTGAFATDNLTVMEIV